MRVLGVDPASSVSGYAVCDTGGDVDFARIFEADHDKPIEKNMQQFYRTLEKAAFTAKVVDACVVEKVSVSWNVNTIRKIAYFEAMAMLVSSAYDVPVYQVQATKARRIVLGKGTLAKEACYPLVVEMFRGEYELMKPNKGGMDQADAIVLALAGEALAGGE